MASAAKILTQAWSIVDFGLPELNDYARRIMEKETKNGMMILCCIFFLLLVSAAILNSTLGLCGPFLYTYGILALLCIHVFIASKVLKDLLTIHLLGITLLVISSTALVLIAHKTGIFSVPLLAGIVFIFLVVPLVPWGLREATIVTVLVYGVFTLSTWSVSGRFDPLTLLLLQFFMISAGCIILTIVARNARLRKKEIKSMYELQMAHDEVRLLSKQDPLTEAWNRRHLQEKFFRTTMEFRQKNLPYFFVLFDIDLFKEINDTYGHDYGDRILQWISKAFRENLSAGELFVRMGGDEFALLMSSDPEEYISKSLRQFNMIVEKFGQQGHRSVSMSFGMVKVMPDDHSRLSLIYKKADMALYAAKKKKGNWLMAGDMVRPDIDRALCL